MKTIQTSLQKDLLDDIRDLGCLRSQISEFTCEQVPEAMDKVFDGISHYLGFTPSLGGA